MTYKFNHHLSLATLGFVAILLLAGMLTQPAQASVGTIVGRTIKGASSVIMKKPTGKTAQKGIKKAVQQGAQKAEKAPGKIIATIEKHPKVLKTGERLGMTGIIASSTKDVAKHALRGEIETVQSNGTLTKEQGPISMNLPKSIDSVGESLQWPFILFSTIVAVAIAIGIVKKAFS